MSGLIIPDDIECCEIAPHLYMGSMPTTFGASHANAGFAALALCAAEFQPRNREFAGIEVLRAMLDDSGPPLTRREAQEAEAVAKRVAELVGQKRNVLVTCQMGVNRSGLVTALALQHLGYDREASIERVRAKRGERIRELLGPRWKPLCNKSFVHYLTTRGFLTSADVRA